MEAFFSIHSGEEESKVAYPALGMECSVRVIAFACETQVL